MADRRLKVVRRWDDWESDAASLGITQWVRTWREENPRAGHPPLRFARHLGREAVELMDGGESSFEIQRIFSTFGREGVCVCGLAPGDPIPEDEVEEVPDGE